MVEDPDELAILSQQQGQRMAESAVARMLESGALRIENKRFIAVPDRRAGLSRADCRAGLRSALERHRARRAG